MAKYCQNCGAELNEQQDICLKCGVRIKKDNVNNTNTDPNAKSKMAAGLLGIFLGTFGVHNFYLGYTGKAVAQLLITVLSCGFLSVVSAIWGLIEGIMILSGSINADANGNQLRD
ncbi:MAG: NINE protein [Bacilli bacterium]